ncbi:NlpC/P60 family protein [Paenibacillus sp. CC-CFT747]|nr:NlpC/P60 family protein [Paenibacillus sp. CC-CFT747]
MGLGLVLGTQAHAEQVKVQVNDDLVHFPDAQPFMDGSSRTQVPVRMVTERMGYQVNYSMTSDQQVKVKISSSTKSVELKTGEKRALVNGQPISIDTNALFTGGRTYVPVRFISEALGTMVQWDQNNYIAIVAADGKYHAPAWYKPQPLPFTIINNAKKYLGVPYAFGGTTPSGFDCSGYVQYLFKQQGTTLPRTASQMYAGAGQFVSEVQPGDLVFFSETSSSPITHVGIYLGNSQFISATTSYGVHIDNLYSGYWGARYKAAKRI